MPNICAFHRILKSECNLQYFTRNCRIKNLDGFERDEVDTYLWRADLLNVNEKVMNISYIMKRCLVNVFERRESKWCAVLTKYRRKVKRAQMITLQMAQQLKAKNINVVPAQLFCLQYKAKFLLERKSLYWWSR